MNRLILLGNGFDLAHGLKTGYNDFIVWYLKQGLESAWDNVEYEDNLISIKKIRSTLNIKVGSQINELSEYVNYYYENGFNDLINNKDLYLEGTMSRPYFSIQVKSKFLEALLVNCNKFSWVDIEIFFYRHLTIILGSSNKNTEYKENLLVELNRSMENLIFFLAKYLQTIDCKKTNPSYSEIFESVIHKNEIATIKLEKDQKPKDSLILNFNYTSTIESYFNTTINSISSKTITVNYIHGKLGNDKNPLIFGFGDELDDYYSRIELEKGKGFLEYIKSFWYFKTSNYHDLIRFIDSDDFQVFILGHSCGLSDRTMLNMIFEHDNCKSIKIFYHEHKDGTNNYTPLTQEISRHFKNKGTMRKKIVSLDRSSPMPQVK